MVQLATLMLAWVVVRNSLPRIKGTSPTLSILSITNLVGMMNSPTYTTRFSKTLSGIFCDLSTICKHILVGLRRCIPRFLNTIAGIRLMLEPRSHNPLICLTFPTSQVSMNLHGSFILGGSFPYIMAT